MALDYRIISIGALSIHELWPQQGAARTPHATCTLIRTGTRNILVDPGLPGQVITARLAERVGLEPQAISDVFLTTFRPSHRWGISAFPDAKWWIGEVEREQVGRALVEQFERAGTDESLRQTLREEIALLKRCQPAPDKLAPQVDLFPLPGFAPGTCGLLLSLPMHTVLIAGDAVATAEHLEQGRVLRGATDIELAQESFREAIEIADILIPGHDNILQNPGRRRY